MTENTEEDKDTDSASDVGVQRFVMPHYTVGIYGETEAIECNGHPISLHDIVEKLNEGSLNDWVNYACGNMSDQTMVALWVERDSAWVETHVCDRKQQTEPCIVEADEEATTLAEQFSIGVDEMSNPQP